MYLWKCWRDTRGAFLTFLGALMLVALLHRAVAADWFGFVSAQSFGVPSGVYQQTADVFLRLMVLLMPLVGFVIGAQGVGSEFDRRTAPFLLTRPRSRSFFLWSSWVLCSAEVVALIAISVTLFAHRLPVPGSPRGMTTAPALTQSIAALLVPAAVILCLTFAFTVFLKKESHGTNAAVAAVFCYSGVVAALRLFYEVNIPVFWELYVGAFCGESAASAAGGDGVAGLRGGRDRGRQPALRQNGSLKEASMYLRKCWRDTLPAVRAFCGALALAHLFYWSVIQDWFGWVASGALNLPQGVWQQVAELTVRTTTQLVPLAGFLIGGEGLAQEFQSKSLIYLLSRPRQRAYLLWGSWGIGALQIALLILLAGVLDKVKPPLATLPNVPFHVMPMLKLAAVGIIITLVLYCLTFMLGVLLRSGRYAVRISMIACLLYGVAASFNSPGGLQLPTLATLLHEATMAAAIPEKYSFPVLLSAGWLSFALGMVLFSQWSFARYEPEG